VQRFVEIDGRRYLWRDILRLRQEQKELELEKQLTLFKLKTDTRPVSQSSADGRYSEPTLFKID
jgi:hypothetical protein